MAGSRLGTESSPHPSRAATLHLLGNHPVLDFTNTSSGRNGGHQLDHLQQPLHLAAWAIHAGVVPPQFPAHSLTMDDLHRAVALREALYRSLICAARRQPPPSGDVALIVAEHGRCLAEAELVPGSDASPAGANGERGAGGADCGGRWRLAWSWPRGGGAAILGPLVTAALPLLTAQPDDRLRCCPGSDCGWLFLDVTRNGRRRWCDMAVCGNRAKAERHRAGRQRAERHRAGQAGRQEIKE